MYDVRDLERALGGISYTLLGNRGALFDKARPILESDGLSITFCKKNLSQGQGLIESTKASIIICGDDLRMPPELLEKKLLAIVDDPRSVFSSLVAEFFDRRPAWGIHPTAFVEKSAQVHPDSYIGPFSYIGESTRIGRNTIIYGHVHIYDHVQIGENVIIHAGVVIGSDGFGYNKDNEGRWNKFPHLGGVTLADDVEIGANSCIDRGTLGDTKVGRGVKLDNLVYVGHNAQIGEDTAVSGNTTVGGSVIGKRVWIAPGCSVKEKLRIGDDSFVGLGSVVVEDVEPGSFVLGVPARKVRTSKPG